MRCHAARWRAAAAPGAARSRCSASQSGLPTVPPVGWIMAADTTRAITARIAISPSGCSSCLSGSALPFPLGPPGTDPQHSGAVRIQAQAALVTPALEPELRVAEVNQGYPLRIGDHQHQPVVQNGDSG